MVVRLDGPLQYVTKVPCVGGRVKFNDQSHVHAPLSPLLALCLRGCPSMVVPDKKKGVSVNIKRKKAREKKKSRRGKGRKRRIIDENISRIHSH